MYTMLNYKWTQSAISPVSTENYVHNEATILTYFLEPITSTVVGVVVSGMQLTIA